MNNVRREILRCLLEAREQQQRRARAIELRTGARPPIRQANALTRVVAGLMLRARYGIIVNGLGG
jgi:hypothetical protein